MGSYEGNNKRIVDPSTSWPESRPILNDCYKICCTLFDEDVCNFRPILYGCRLPCCNVREDVLREEWPNNVGSYLEERIMPKRCSLSPVQGTDMRAVPGYTPAASTSLITNLSSGEESAEDCLEFEDSDDSPYTTDVGYYSCC
ncbi:hypothetical protein E2320_000030 [Naja naja]|nr:hypothetical protein E2320_000030 [Naja naja]